MKGSPISISWRAISSPLLRFLLSITRIIARGSSNIRMLRVTISSSDMGMRLLTPGVSTIKAGWRLRVVRAEVSSTVVPG